MTRTINEKMVFVKGSNPDGSPFLFIGIPKGAWELMKNGKVSLFDLNKVGLRIQVVICGGATNDELMGSLANLGIDTTQMQQVSGTGSVRGIPDGPDKDVP